MTSESCVAYYHSPIGWIRLVSLEEKLVGLDFVEAAEGSHRTPLLNHICRLLDGYFVGSTLTFDVPINLQGTEFQKSVWNVLLTIPYGAVLSYQDVAYRLGKPRAVRAVGAANGRNPISVIVPCHRVIGSDGNLTGYGGGIWRKEWLLRHEGVLLV